MLLLAEHALVDVVESLCSYESIASEWGKEESLRRRHRCRLDALRCCQAACTECVSELVSDFSVGVCRERREFPCFCQVAVFSAQVSRESPPPAPMFCIGSGISCARINCSVGVDVLQCASCAGSVARERMAVEIRSKLGMAPSRNIQSPGSEAVALLGLLPCWLA